MTTATQYREMASQEIDKAEESFQRCDTDGFVSQWAHGCMSKKYDLQASIEDNGGKWSFPALFNLEGQRVAAKLIDGRFGLCWALCDKDGNFTGKFISAFPARESTMKRKGYVEGTEEVPARAELKGNGGRGLSGALSVRATAIRLDCGYPDTAVVE